MRVHHKSLEVMNLKRREWQQLPEKYTSPAPQILQPIDLHIYLSDIGAPNVARAKEPTSHITESKTERLGNFHK